MDNLSTLLVALMFITILTLGIASILGELAEAVRSSERRSGDRLLFGWVLLLLFAYFDLFWHTADIALVEKWEFHLFLFVETGPVLLLFATNIVLGAAGEESQTETPAALNRSGFFWIFALLHVWEVLAGLVLGVGFTTGSAIAAVITAICVILALTNQRRIHILGLVLLALLYVATAVISN